MFRCKSLRVQAPAIPPELSLFFHENPVGGVLSSLHIVCMYSRNTAADGAPLLVSGVPPDRSGSFARPASHPRPRCIEIVSVHLSDVEQSPLPIEKEEIAPSTNRA